MIKICELYEQINRNSDIWKTAKDKITTKHQWGEAIYTASMLAMVTCNQILESISLRSVSLFSDISSTDSQPEQQGQKNIKWKRSLLANQLQNVIQDNDLLEEEFESIK